MGRLDNTDERWISATSEELVAKVQQGHAEAFAEIFKRHHERIARYLRLQGTPAQDVEDVLGDVFCRALTHIDSFDVSRGKSYLSYLYTIARRAAMDRYRTRSTALPLEEADEDWEPSDGFREDALVEQIINLDRVRAIRKAMDGLSQSDRELIVLAYDRELTARQIRDLIGKPSITSVTTAICRAMKRLKTLVEQPKRSRSTRMGDS